MPSSEENFYKIFNLAPMCMAISSAKTEKLLLVNDCFVRLTGFSREEALGKNTLELGIWTDHSARASGREQLKKSNTIEQTEVSLRMKDGEVRTFILSSELIEFKGEPAILNAAIDITERKQAEAAREQSESRYRTLFNSTDEGFCVIEVLFDAQNKPLDYRFLELNPQFENQTGLKDAVGKTAKELVPKLEQHWFDIYGKVALEGEGFRFENGSAEMGRWFDVYAFRIGGSESRKVGILFKDITEQKQATLALQEFSENLESQVRLRTQQVRDLAGQLTLAETQERARLAQLLHDELQQQLYALQFALSDVQRYLNRPEANEALLNAKTLLKEALEICRNATTNLSPPILKGEGLVEALQWLASHMQDLYGLKVQLSSKASTPLPEALRVLLFSLVRELLFNVVKHAKVETAKVLITESEQDLVIQVSDNGMGMNPEALKEKGTGLGLSGVRQRLQLFDGHLELKSDPGKGTVVSIYMPLKTI